MPTSWKRATDQRTLRGFTALFSVSHWVAYGNLASRVSAQRHGDLSESKQWTLKHTFPPGNPVRYRDAENLFTPHRVSTQSMMGSGVLYKGCWIQQVKVTRYKVKFKLHKSNLQCMCDPCHIWDALNTKHYSWFRNYTYTRYPTFYLTAPFSSVKLAAVHVSHGVLSFQRLDMLFVSSI